MSYSGEHDPDNWHAHRLFVTESLVDLRAKSKDQGEQIETLKTSIGKLQVKVALISSAISMAGTNLLNWILAHHQP